MEICQCHGIFCALVLQSVDNQFDFFQFFSQSIYSQSTISQSISFRSPFLISIGDLFIRSRSVHSMEYAESTLPNFDPAFLSAVPGSSDVQDSEKAFFSDGTEVDELTQLNDLAILRGQMSTDDVVNDEDIVHTEMLIDSDRAVMDSYTNGGFWTIFRRASINIILPFINGMMLGFGEILAHEIGFRYNWLGARVQPARRMRQKEESRYL